MTLEALPNFCCICGGKLVKADHEMVCQACGYVSDIVSHGEAANFKDEDRVNTSHHAPGLGTNAAEAASTYLKKITKGHVLKSSNNKYIVYAISCLDNFIKSHGNFRLLYEILRITINKAINNYINAKKMAKEGIEEIRVTRVINGVKEMRIRYYSIDRIIEKTILAFCTKNVAFGDNIKVESFNFHKLVRHSTRGNKSGTLRENGYKEHNPALDILSCLKHGPFPEKSHNAHFKKADHMINCRQITFPTYQKYFVLGFSYCDDMLKNNVKQNHVQRQNILRGDSKLCKNCRCDTEEVVKVSYRNTKKQKQKKYTSVISYHVIRINGRKVLVKGCLDDYAANNTVNTIKQPISF